MQPAKTQISLGIRPVWSESLLCTRWVAKDPSFLHADNKDSDQTGWMPRLIWVFAGHTVILLVLSWGGSNQTADQRNRWAVAWQNQETDVCTHRRLRPAWAFAQSDQSSLSAWRSIGTFGYPSSAQRRLISLVRCPGWSCLRWVHRSFCWFCYAVAQIFIKWVLMIIFNISP